jgi:hypothetical protein
MNELQKAIDDWKGLRDRLTGEESKERMVMLLNDLINRLETLPQFENKPSFWADDNTWESITAEDKDAYHPDEACQYNIALYKRIDKKKK